MRAVRTLAKPQLRPTLRERARSSIREYPENTKSNAGIGKATRRYIVQPKFNHSTLVTSGKSALSSGNKLTAGPITRPAKLVKRLPFNNVSIILLTLPGD